MDNTPPNTPDDYDSPWKTALDRYFLDFMALYFPAAHAQIDWNKGYESLDTELQSLVRDANLGKRFADKLVKVTLLNGEQDLVYVHVEVQGSREPGFAERIYVYNYRIFDRYHQPVTSLVVLADTDPTWRPGAYTREQLGCRQVLEFPCVKLLDYAGREDELLASHNPFAIITAAHLLTQQTRNDTQRRYEHKKTVVKLLYQKGWDKQAILDLFAAIDWMMHLPQALAQQFRIDLEKHEQVTNMRYITSVEKLIMEECRQEGQQEGLQKGLQEGEQHGVLKGRREMLARLISLKYGDCPADAKQRIDAADEVQLTQWIDRILTADSLQDLLG